MLPSGTLRRLLLSWTCVCVYGNPVHLPDFARPAASGSAQPADGQHVSGPKAEEVGAASHGLESRPEGTAPVTQAGKEDGADGESGPSGEARQVGMASALRGARGRPDPESADEPALTPGGATARPDNVSAQTLAPHGFAASSPAPPHLETGSMSKDPAAGDGRDGTTPPADWDSLQDNKDAGISRPSSTEAPDPPARVQRLTSPSPIPPSVLVPPRTSTPLLTWGHEDATASTLPDPLLPEIGPNLMPREDGPESLWTEAGADTAVPPSQDEATEGTMSSEALPLIFEPFEDATQERAGAAAAAAVSLVPGSAQPPTAMATGHAPLSQADLERLVTVETDGDGPSRAPPLLMPDWTSSWQTSGAELLEPIGQSGTARTPNPAEDLPTRGPSLSSFQRASTTVATATRQPAHKSRSGLEEMDSEEEPDEDEEDENSEESVEEESEEDLTERPKMEPPYSLIPPPPVWVQRNQGLMRSWVELIREKAGYVSGMLAPVGIGIAGALLIVGALYSIRMIHRKRRNSFKHQRRKQPREPGTSRQDQAMLLADSSEDEF